MTDAGLARADSVAAIDYESLALIDWSFSSAHTRGATHAIHPYPAKFIPQIPRALIGTLQPRDGTAVLDPFCGSGTTLVEAAAAGFPAVGIDLHPLACLISKVKVTPLLASVSSAAERAVTRAALHRGGTMEIPAVDHWFQRDVQLELSALVLAIAAEPDADVRDALRVALSSIIVRVSNQESDTRYAAVAKNIHGPNVRVLFQQAAHKLDLALSKTWARLLPSPHVDVINRDVLTVAPGDIGRRVSLVVTSPPYPNAYEYWLYHKYRMYWLGMDPIAVRQKEIGARPHYFKRHPHTAADFGRQMAQVFKLLAGVLVPGGHACFQVGRSIIRGEFVDNAALIRRAAEPYGFSVAAAMQRTIPQGRKAFNPSHARIKLEDVLVFRLDS